MTVRLSVNEFSPDILSARFPWHEAFGPDTGSLLFLAGESQGAPSRLIRAFAVGEGSGPVLPREEELLRSLCHPSLAAMTDAWEQDGWRCQAFAHPGGTLLSREEQPPLPAEKALQLVGTVATALGELHAQGLVCGALGRETLVLNAAGQPVLFHAGLPGSPALAPGGPSRYLTPEQAQGRSAGAPGDLYHLGILLFELLTGTLPYDADSVYRLSMLHIHGPLPRLPESLGFGQNLLDRLLAKDPALRPTAAEALRDIEALLQEDRPAAPAVAPERSLAPQETPPEPPPPLPSPSSPPHPAPARPHRAPLTLWGLGASFALGALIGVCFLLLVRGPHLGASGEPPKTADPPQIGSEMQRALALHRDGRTDEALEALKGLSRRHPTSTEIRNNLAVFYAAEGELEQAREELQNTLKLDANFAAVAENLETVRQEIARQTYRRALNLEPEKSAPALTLLPAATAGREEAEAPSPARVPDGIVAQTATGPVEEPRPQPPSPAPPEEAALSGYAPWQQEVIAILLQWASAWSQQDVESYLSHYSLDFHPEDGLSLEEWKAQRNHRLKRPGWIAVDLEDFQVSTTGPDTVQVKLVQEYRADTYHDRTLKSLNLVREEGRWRIFLERSLGYLE